MNMTGKVYLIGAGPGSSDLVTSRGLSLLKKADVVLYDYLISYHLLCQCRSDALLIPVGKRAGHHSLPQEEISNEIVKMAEKYDIVVRLKGGDPFVFGRGGEEIQYLREHGIHFETVPGVTSAIAALSSAGIPVTHRGLARSFHVITGSTKDGDKIRNLDLYAKMEGTLIFMMSHRRIPEISAGLMEYGMDPDTPCAIVSSGTYVTERRINATLRTVAGILKKEAPVPPSVFVVGGTAALDMNCDYDSLSGCRVGITGSTSFTGRMTELLKDNGARVLPLPNLSISPIGLSDGELADILSHEWLVFTSANGVSVFFDELSSHDIDIRSLAGCRFAAVGSGTENELRKHGLFADLVPNEYSVDALAAVLRDHILSEYGNHPENVRVAALRSTIGSKCLNRCLTEAGIGFSDYPLYRPLIQNLTETYDEKADDGPLSPAAHLSDDRSPEYNPTLDYLVFGSSSGVHNFRPYLSKVRIAGALVAIGNVTAGEIRKIVDRDEKLNTIPVLTAEKFSASGILETLKKDWKKNRPSDE